MFTRSSNSIFEYLQTINRVIIVNYYCKLNYVGGTTNKRCKIHPIRSNIC